MDPSERFEIEREAGAGGMGTVYRALDRETGKPVALKLLRRQQGDDAVRFQREAALLADLRHPGLVQYVAHGQTKEGAPFLAMEWLEGRTLAALLESRTPTVKETLALGRVVAETLAAAHRHGVVHRDIKPSNIFLVDGDVSRPRIIDFGLASSTRNVRPLTRTGLLMGTIGYIAPEQARGARTLDPRTDLFSLGCVLYECLTGSPPFIADHPMGVLAKILFDEAPHLRELRPELPEELSQVVMRLLAKAPEERPADAAEVAHELERIELTDEPPPSTPRVHQVLGASEQRVLCVVLAAHATPPPAPSRDDSTLRSIALDAALAALVELARKFGARLETLVDGSVVVTFDGPLAPTDQAGRAVRCALAMRKLLPSAPIAVATGRAVIGNRAPVGAVVDRAINTLGTFSGEPLGESVRLDEVTAGLLGPRFEVRGDDRGLYASGEHEVDQVRTLLGKPTPCVGRDRELTLLTSLYAECAGEKVARAVVVVGPPGQGKSRVRYEFLRHLREKDHCEIVFGRADSLSAGATFGLLRHALRRLCGLTDGESLETQRRKLRARLTRHLKQAAAERVVTFLGELCGVRADSGDEALRAARADATLMGDAMQEAWETWLEAECRAQPVVLVLEDLQWGDLPTVRFVDRALRNLRDSPLLVLALARPEVYQQFPSLWAEREVQEIRLGALTKRAAEKLVTGVLGALDAETRQRIVDAADGNAFFLEELIRQVSTGDTTLPDSVLAMMQARFEALGQRARRILRAASIFGERFWLGGVKELAGDTDLKESIDDLVERELIARRSQGALPDELVFRHALVRQAAYAMLTDEDRALGHRLAGQWLERAWRAASESGGEARRGPVDAVMLAEHLVLGRVPEQALLWYRLAAEQALEGNDFENALQRAEKAIACGADGALRGVLCLIQTEAHAWSGKPADAEKLAVEAASLLPIGSAPWFRAVDEAIVSACRLGESKSAVIWARRAAEPDGGPGAESQQVTCLARGALRLMFSGLMEPAAELVARLDLLGPEVLARVDRASAARVHELRALAAYFAGDVEGNLEFLESAFATYDQAGDTRNSCQARVYLGFAYVELGMFVRAEQVLREAWGAAERLGLRAVAANALHNLGWVLAVLGNPQLGRETEERALEMFRQLNEPRKQCHCCDYVARIALLGNNLELAEKAARDAIDCGLRASEPDVPFSQAVLARALLQQGRIDEALAQAKEAMQRLTAVEATSHEGEIRLMYAEALHAAGDSAAKEAIAAARDRLLQRAERISNPTRRESFLMLVPENGRTMRLAAEWGSAEEDRF